MWVFWGAWMESLLAHPGPITIPRASVNPPGPEVTPFQVTATEPSTLPWRCCFVPFESPCPRAICAVAVELPGPSHLLPCAVSTGVGPLKPDGLRTGCWEGWSRAAHPRSFVSFVLLVSSLDVYQLWPKGRLGGSATTRGSSRPSAEEVAIWPRQWPWYPSPACRVGARVPCVCHVYVSQRASCGALHAWVGLCGLLGCVLLCTGAEPLLGLNLGPGVHRTAAGFLRGFRLNIKNVVPSSSPGWEGNS